MPNLKDKLIVPVEIPAWGVITFIVSGAFGYGILYNTLQGLVKSQDKVEIIYERQIRNIETVNLHKEVLREHQAKIENHESRLVSLERLSDRGHK